ncbi:hypothetical protein [Lentiprolixibacter aurantiacus]|uniref:Uncharacterized protein n=1 Tax=Lentiprolixibacter aurantiacus TaxID=2993939 RepID=A0AAE3ML96_9FLAO|nr:hypothetical protein [Lentiprolixibacter aurantiacus]MCX2719243.1 hypothetical protein [Lentiprolixibacter aurantiacus]
MIQDHKGLKVSKDHREYPVLPELTVHKDRKVNREFRGQKDQQDRKANREFRVQKGQQDRKVSKDHREYPDLPELTVHKDPRDQWGPKGRKGYRVK